MLVNLGTAIMDLMCNRSSPVLHVGMGDITSDYNRQDNRYVSVRPDMFEF